MGQEARFIFGRAADEIGKSWELFREQDPDKLPTQATPRFISDMLEKLFIAQSLLIK